MGKKQLSKGFSLIELSLGIAVLGLMIYTALAVYTERSAIDKVAVTNKKLDVIEQSLRQYYLANGRLPCPANGTLNFDDAAFGLEVAGATCTFSPPGVVLLGTAVAGVIPNKSLNLPDSYAYDAWGNKISYAVTTALSGTSAAWATANNATLIISDFGGNPLNVTATSTAAAYVLVSHGKNGIGAWRRTATTTKIPSLVDTMLWEIENGNVDTSGANDNLDVNFQEGPFNDSDLATVIGTYNDDLIRWKPKGLIDYDADRY